MEGAGWLLIMTERAQWLQAGTEEVERLHEVTEKIVLFRLGKRKFGCYMTVTEGAHRLLAGKEGCQRLSKG